MAAAAASDDDATVQALGALSLDAPVDYRATVLSFVGWRRVPQPAYVTPDDFAAMQRDAVFGVPHESLPLLLPAERLRRSFTVQPRPVKAAPEPKPNLLVAAATAILCHVRAAAAAPSAEDAAVLGALRKYHVVLPRNPLKQLLTARDGEPWLLYACRPLEGGPVFVERSRTYEATSGTIGALFEREMTERRADFHRVYAVSEGALGPLALLLTGEVDAVDAQGRPVELKTQPRWAKPDPARSLQALLQSRLAGVASMVTGAFTAPRGGPRNGPVTFSQADIKYQRIEDYARGVRASDVDGAFGYALEVLQAIVRQCAAVGTVYAVEGARRPLSVRVREMRPNEVAFPVSARVLSDLAAAFSSK